MGSYIAEIWQMNESVIPSWIADMEKTNFVLVMGFWIALKKMKNCICDGFLSSDISWPRNFIHFFFLPPTCRKNPVGIHL